MDNGHVSKFFDFINVDITLPREKENYFIKQVLRTNGKYAGKERERAATQSDVDSIDKRQTGKSEQY